MCIVPNSALQGHIRPVSFIFFKIVIEISFKNIENIILVLFEFIYYSLNLMFSLFYLVFPKKKKSSNLFYFFFVLLVYVGPKQFIF